MKSYIYIMLMVLTLLITGPAYAQFPTASEADDAYLDLMEDLEADEKPLPQVADPLYYWNKAMFHFNDKLYFWVFKPVAKGYKAVTPELMRTGVKNFFHNLTTPLRFVNCLLQGRPEHAGVELGRFMVNTTVGVLGFGSPADSQPDLKMPPEEDFGQTLGVYGLGNGFYLVWPILGPSTLRDSVGLVGASFLSPVSYVDPTSASVGIGVFDKVNGLTFHLGDYESLKDSAIKPYEAFRDAYIQYRTKKLNEK